MSYRFQCASLLLVLIAFTGCAKSSEEPAVSIAELKAKYILAEEPLGVLPVLAAVDELAEREQEIVVLGRIGGIKNPCDAKEAVFVMTDPSVDAAVGNSDHACGADCHFCQKPKKDLPTLAIVKLVDAEGKPYPYAPGQFADLVPDQMVVVRGKAKVDSLGNLTVAANGVYIRR